MRILLLVLLAPAVLACVVPEDGMLIDQSMQFCNDVFYVNNISVSGDNINIDCNSAVLKSWTGGTGILIENSANITVSGCRIVNYDTGFQVENSTRVFLDDNHLIRNKIGTLFVGVSDSATLNQDISLQESFLVFNSNNNVLSLTNRVVRGDFCQDNFCNKQRSTVALFVQPRTTLPQMKDWLIEQITGKSSKKLFNWVFGDL